LSAAYKIISKILLSRLTPYAEGITEDHLCGFRRYWSTTDHMFYIRQILEKMGYSEAVHQFFIDFKKACDSVRKSGVLI
jgi:retron-type reverse transcriptase